MSRPVRGISESQVSLGSVMSSWQLLTSQLTEDCQAGGWWASAPFQLVDDRLIPWPSLILRLSLQSPLLNTNTLHFPEREIKLKCCMKGPHSHHTVRHHSQCEKNLKILNIESCWFRFRFVFVNLESRHLPSYLIYICINLFALIPDPHINL